MGVVSVVVTVLVTLVVVVIAFGDFSGVQLVSAQSTSYSQCVLLGKTYVSMQCQTYLQLSPALSTPSLSCCEQLKFVQTVWGVTCYCEIMATVDTSRIDRAKMCSLPKDCGVAADMPLCPCSGTSTTPSTSPGRAPPTPSSSYVPVTPASTTNSASGGSTSGGSSSLAVPIGASVGGMSVALLVIWLIMSRCRIHLKWDMNAPCWCCYRSPKPVSANHNEDKVPSAPTPVQGYRPAMPAQGYRPAMAPAHGYRV